MRLTRYASGCRLKCIRRARIICSRLALLPGVASTRPDESGADERQRDYSQHFFMSCSSSHPCCPNFRVRPFSEMTRRSCPGHVIRFSQVDRFVSTSLAPQFASPPADTQRRVGWHSRCTIPYTVCMNTTDPVRAVDSRRLSAVGSKNTTPELKVRRALWSLGFRYRIHVRSLPGTPDVVLTRRRVAVFVNGCFWHGHTACGGYKPPRNNVSYWSDKVERNRTRDAASQEALAELGWRTIVVWECETSNDDVLRTRLRREIGLDD